MYELLLFVRMAVVALRILPSAVEMLTTRVNALIVDTTDDDDNDTVVSCKLSLSVINVTSDVSALIGEQGERQAEQGRVRQLDPDLVETRTHRRSFRMPQRRMRKRSVRAVTVMVISVLPSKETASASHSLDIR